MSVHIVKSIILCSMVFFSAVAPICCKREKINWKQKPNIICYCILCCLFLVEICIQMQSFMDCNIRNGRDYSCIRCMFICISFVSFSHFTSAIKFKLQKYCNKVSLFLLFKATELVDKIFEEFKGTERGSKRTSVLVCVCVCINMKVQVVSFCSLHSLVKPVNLCSILQIMGFTRHLQSFYVVYAVYQPWIWIYIIQMATAHIQHRTVQIPLRPSHYTYREMKCLYVEYYSTRHTHMNFQLSCALNLREHFGCN